MMNSTNVINYFKSEEDFMRQARRARTEHRQEIALSLFCGLS